MSLGVKLFASCGTRDEHAKLWWLGHYGYQLPENALSQYCISIENDGIPLLVGYIYPSKGSKICWLGFIVSDPNGSKFMVGTGLKLLFQVAQDWARNMGYSILYVSHESETLHRVAGELGFVKGSNVTAYWKGLDQ